MSNLRDILKNENIFIESSEKGKPKGVASLDKFGKITVDQLPFSISENGFNLDTNNYISTFSNLSDLSDITEAKVNLNLDEVDNVSIKKWNGSNNLSIVGEIKRGQWKASPIKDEYIESSKRWNKIDSAIIYSDIQRDGICVIVGSECKTISIKGSKYITVTNGDGVGGSPTIKLNVGMADSYKSGFLSPEHFDLLQNSTFGKTGNTLVKRDKNGRAKVNPPENPFDIATKGYVDKKIEEIKKIIEKKS